MKRNIKCFFPASYLNWHGKSIDHFIKGLKNEDLGQTIFNLKEIEEHLNSINNQKEWLCTLKEYLKLNNDDLELQSNHASEYEQLPTKVKTLLRQHIQHHDSKQA